MQSIRKSYSHSKRFGLQQFYQDLSKVQSSLGKNNRKTIQSPIRPERQKKLFQVNVENFYKQKQTTTLIKKNIQKAKLQLTNKNQLRMKSLNNSQLNTDVQPYDRNYRQSQMPSFQMQQSLQMTQQYSNMNDYPNASLKYSENNFSNRELENLLSDDRLSQSSQKHCKQQKYSNFFIKHDNYEPGQISQQVVKPADVNDKLILQMQKRAQIYDYVRQQQNASGQILKQLIKKRTAKHNMMKKIIGQFKKMSNLQQIYSMEQLLSFLKARGSSQRLQKK